MKMVLVALVLAAVVVCAVADDRDKIPNGRKVFASGHWWSSTFTKTWRGSGGNNAFGTAFAAAGSQWTSALCQADTDGDGFTNGEELGDPSCTWTVGATPARSGDVSHPGLKSSIPAYTTKATPAGSCTRDGDISATAATERTSSRSATVTVPDGTRFGTTFTHGIATVLKQQPDNFAAEVRSTCPFLASGIVDWHSAASWGGTLPSEGSDVTLPANTKVLISSCSLPNAAFGSITIPEGSELIFSDAPIELRVKDIIVRGKLTIGSESCPIHSPVTITFVARKNERSQYSNGIRVEGNGQLNAWGSRTDWTWTRISATAPRGSFTLLLQDPVDWGVGDEIVITTSIWKDTEENQNEVRRIVAISTDKTIVTLDEALIFTHYGGEEYQSEVGLLTRSILFRGWTNGYDDNYGGHTMAAGENAIYNVVGVRASRMGQRNIIARYPFHMHLLLEAGANSTMQQLACFESYFRCAVIHKTNNTILRKSVSYNSSGHTYYLEEGAEMGNTIDFNLAAHVHPIGKPAAGGAQGGEQFIEDTDAIQPADHTAAGFYIPNPSNTIVGNAASGGWSGFAFPIFEQPIKLSKDIPIEPYRYEILRFDANTAHSSGHHWGDAGCVYIGGKLWEDDSGKLRYTNGRHEQGTMKWPFGDSVRAWHKVTNLRTWMCQKGFSSWGPRIDISTMECTDCTRSAVLFGESSVQNCVFMGNSNNDPYDMREEGRQGFGFYDTWVKTQLVNVTFKNYQRKPNEPRWNRNGVIVDLTHSDIFKPWGISATRNLRYENVDQSIVLRRWVRETGASRMMNVVDWDGSMVESGSCDGWIIGSEVAWWDLGTENDCYYRADWNVYICKRVPGREVVGLDMELPGIQEELDIRTNNDDLLTQEDRDKLYIGHISQFAPNDDRRLLITKNRHLATGLGGIGWYMYNRYGMPPQSKIIPINIPQGTYILLAISYPAGTTFDIYNENRWGTQRKLVYNQVASPNAVANSNGTAYHFDGSRLWLKVLDHWQDYPKNAFVRGDVDIIDAYNGAFLWVNANCLSKVNGNCAPPAAPEPPTINFDLPINECNSLSDIIAPIEPFATPECQNETLVMPENVNGTCWDYRTSWRCLRGTYEGCNAYCKPGCHMWQHTYRCSYQKPCSAAEKPKTALEPWCEWVNRGHSAGFVGCTMYACNYTSNSTTFVNLPPGSSCKLTADEDGYCNPSGLCKSRPASIARPSTTRIDSIGGTDASKIVLTVGDENSAAHGAAGADVKISVTFAPGASSADVVNATAAATTAGMPAGKSAYEVNVGAANIHLVRSVTVFAPNGTRVWDDFHYNRNLIPSVEFASEGVANRWTFTVSPQTWIDEAVAFPTADSSVTATGTRTMTGFQFDLTSVLARSTGEIKITFKLAGGNTVTRSIPCVGQSGNQACYTGSTSVRAPLSQCKHSIIDNGATTSYGRFYIPGSEATMIYINGRNFSYTRWNRQYYQGGVGNLADINSTDVVVNFGAYNETFRLFRSDLGQYKQLACLTGSVVNATAVADERGMLGQCTASRMCSPTPVTKLPDRVATPAPGWAAPGPVQASASSVSVLLAALLVVVLGLLA